MECKALTCGDRVQPVMRLSRDECLCWVREKGCGVTGGRGKVGGLVGDRNREEGCFMGVKPHRLTESLGPGAQLSCCSR